MANPGEDNYDRTFDAIDRSAARRRAEKKEKQKFALLVACGLLALILVTVLVLVIGCIANAGSREDDGPDNPTKDTITWTSVTMSAEDVKKGSLLLSNDTVPYARNDANADLDKIYDYRATMYKGKNSPYQLAGMSKFMNHDALVALDRMLADCAAATGSTDVVVRLAYVTAEEAETWKSSLRSHVGEYVLGYGCELSITRNGTSYALATDATISGWLNQNAARYGFIVRYPDEKAAITGVTSYTNFFRYVGVPHATFMQANNLCLEEYLDILTQYNNKNRLTITGADGKIYDVYYCAVTGNTSVRCPANFSYTVSGTNNGGVVITVDRTSAPPTEADTGADTTAPTAESGTVNG